MTHRYRPDIMFLVNRYLNRHSYNVAEKNSKTVTVHQGDRILLLKNEKIEKYFHLAMEKNIKKMKKVSILPIVISALVTCINNFKKYISELKLSERTASVQKTVLLGWASLLPLAIG